MCWMHFSWSTLCKYCMPQCKQAFIGKFGMLLRKLPILHFLVRYDWNISDDMTILSNGVCINACIISVCYWLSSGHYWTQISLAGMWCCYFLRVFLLHDSVSTHYALCVHFFLINLYFSSFMAFKLIQHLVIHLFISGFPLEWRKMFGCFVMWWAYCIGCINVLSSMIRDKNLGILSSLFLRIMIEFCTKKRMILAVAFMLGWVFLLMLVMLHLEIRQLWLLVNVSC